MLTCARCQHSARGCRGPCPCTLTGKDVTTHKRLQFCPVGHFGSATPPPGWSELPDAPLPTCGRCGSTDHAIAACPIPADYDVERDKDKGRCCS